MWFSAIEVSALSATRGSRSRSKNTPFDEARLQGRVCLTLAGGRIVYDERMEG
jgi:dihydroorotase-like cyclic amidohydrolase